ncbi:MAG: hypothetical protein Q4G21_01390 [Dermabacter sp.]|nr:hypothetical protein [Dermabacter sp.]
MNAIVANSPPACAKGSAKGVDTRHGHAARTPRFPPLNAAEGVI